MDLILKKFIDTIRGCQKIVYKLLFLDNPVAYIETIHLIHLKPLIHAHIFMIFINEISMTHL